MLKNKRPTCREIECFACEDTFSGWKCNILEAKTKHEDCPFFKTVAQARKDREEAVQHLRDIGRYDLIEKYNVHHLEENGVVLA